MSELREALNNVIVEGILHENKLDYKNDKEGKAYISGDIIIDVGEDNLVPINFFTYEMKKDGNKNKIYQSLQNVIENYKSVAKHGNDADRIKVTGGRIEGNDFYNASGNLISTFRIRSNFVNKITGEYKPQASFKIEASILSVADEIKDDAPTDRLQVMGVVPMYGGKISVITFYVVDPKAIAYIKSNYNKGETVNLIGAIDNQQIETTVVEEMEFGDDVINTYNRIKRELIITNGTKPYSELPDKEAKAFDAATIKQALIQREVELKQKLEEVQAKNDNLSFANNEDVPF